MPLGEDSREMSMIESRRDLIPLLQSGDIILQIHPLYELSNAEIPPKWRVTRRVNNPANFTIQYWLVLIAENDSGFDD